MRTCLLLPHAFKYKETGSSTNALLPWNLLDVPEGSCAMRGCYPPTWRMHFVRTETYIPVLFVAPFTLSLFPFLPFFLCTTPPTRLSIQISFLFLQVSTTDESRQGKRFDGSSLVTRVHRLKETLPTRASRANQEEKLRYDDPRQPK